MSQQLDTVEQVLSHLVISLKVDNKVDKRLIEEGLKLACVIGELKQAQTELERS